jgi:putative transposase
MLVLAVMVHMLMCAPMGYAPQVRHGTEEQHARNGKGHQTVQTDPGPLHLAVPRARTGSCTPPLLPKRQRRLEGFDVKGLRL